MYTLIINLAAITTYIGGIGYLVMLLRNKHEISGQWVGAMALCATALHWAGLLPLLINDQGVNLSFFAAACLLSAVINTLVLVSGLRKPVYTLYILLMPLAVATIAMLLSAHQPSHHLPLSNGVASHVILSILAYSLLTIATAQALLLAFQTRQLKHRHAGGVTRLLPPLQTMESLLFEMLWLGFGLLTLALVTGIGFMDDMLAQHLAHKTAFSVVAWLIYGLLLFGRHRLGWRGHTAIRFTLGGFAALMLAYFGSKFVLEILLGSGA